MWEARSVLGLPVVTMTHQGGAETPCTPLQLCSPGLLRTVRPWLSPATLQGHERCLGQGLGLVAEERGRRWMEGKGVLSYPELPLPPPVLPCSTLSPAPSILQD